MAEALLPNMVYIYRVGSRVEIYYDLTGLQSQQNNFLIGKRGDSTKLSMPAAGTRLFSNAQRWRHISVCTATLCKHGL